jgi:hypothetical protein
MTLAKVSALLPFGMFVGAMVPMLLLIDSVIVAVVFLFAVGALAGFFVVPMNAMLQHRGCTLLTAGRSIAVQGCNENGGILLMLALYSVAIAGAVSMETLLVGFGVLITTLMAVIWLSASRKPVASAIQT